MKDVRFTISVLGLGLSILYGFSSPEDSEKATWLWQAESIGGEQQKILNFARENGVTLMYVHIDMEKPFSYYRPFLRAASEQGIEIHAVAGHPKWALEGHRERMLRIARWVKEYNQGAEVAERIRGIQLDIEPYLLPEWEEDRERIVREWQANIDAFLREAKRDSDLIVSAAIAFWLDEIPTGNGQPLSDWMMERFDTLVLMGYRDKAEGSNGILELIAQEMEEARKQQKKVLVAVNMKEMDESHTSFAEEGTAEMEKQLDVVAQTLADNPSFQGVAIHDYRYWEQLAEDAPAAEPEKQMGTYIWRAELLRTEKEEILDFVREHDIDLLYIRIDMGMPFEYYRAFNREAKKEGIEIHAMGGHPVWALTESREKIFRLVDWVRSYNGQAAEDERFEGIHLDIEPYVLPVWSATKEEVLRQWMGNVRAFAEKLKESPRLESSVDLAAWLDNSQTPGHPDLPFSHWMISQLDHTTLMAFRDFAEGPGGILDMVESEIRYAESTGKELIIAVEMKESGEAEYVSFFEEGKAAMNLQLNIVRHALKLNTVLRGIAVHAYEYWKQAKE